MKSFYLLLIAAVISVTSCRTKEGEPGPAGEASLNKQGSVSGTITYTDGNGNNATTPFTYEYYESLADNKFWYENSGQSVFYYAVNFKRRDLKDNNNNFNFILEGTSTNNVEAAPSVTSTNFSLLKVINNELYEFYGDDFTITNLSIDPTTGRVLFDFTGDILVEGNEATVIGKVDVILNRSNVYVGNGG